MLSNKRIIVCGVANARSIAWHVAKKFRKEGAQVLLTYQKPEFEKKILSLVDSECQENAIGLPFKTFCCDVTNENDLVTLHDSIRDQYSSIDSLFHAIAFAPSSALKNDLLSVSKEDFSTTMAISSYSLIALTNALDSLFQEKKTSITALSFIGSQQVVSGYGVMSVAKAALESTAMQLAHSLGPRGIRMNILRAPPLNTLAARGIPHFLEMKKQLDSKRMMVVEDPMEAVCNTAVFLASDQSMGITGECINVDSGASHVSLYTLC